MYLEWCRVKSNGKKVPFLSSYRFPTRRQADPTSHDLDRERRAKKMLAELNLPIGLLEVASLKNSSAHAPYHGSQHLLTVALNCKEAAEYHALDQAASRPLILAALFHDFAHLLNKTVQDSVNVEAAVSGMLNFLPMGADELPEDEIKEAISLIRATEFPHHAASNISEGIIQDADMMQTLEPDGQRFLDGLSTERGRRITVAQNDEFMDSIQGNTEWGRKKLHPVSKIK
jgi:hypothetical protein